MLRSTSYLCFETAYLKSSCPSLAFQKWLCCLKLLFFPLFSSVISALISLTFSLSPFLFLSLNFFMFLPTAFLAANLSPNPCTTVRTEGVRQTSDNSSKGKTYLWLSISAELAVMAGGACNFTMAVFLWRLVLYPPPFSCTARGTCTSDPPFSVISASYPSANILLGCSSYLN